MLNELIFFYYQVKMKQSISLLLLVLLSLMATGNAITTYNYTFSNNFVGGTALTNKNYIPSYDLGVVNVGETIKFRFQFPNGRPNTSALVFNYLPLTLILAYQDPLNNIINYLTADTITGTFTFPPFPNFSGAYTQYQANYTVIFRNPAMTSAKFLLIMQSVYGLSLSIQAYISVLVETPRTTVRQTEILRFGVSKVIYISSPGNNTYRFTSYPNVVSREHVLFMFNLNQNQTGTDDNLTGNNWRGSSLRQIVSNERVNNSNPVFVNGVANYDISLSPGYYAIFLLPTLVASVNQSLAWFSFPSESYQCPYDLTFPDLNEGFQPCRKIAKKVFEPQGLPCVDFDKDIGECTTCINGYTLINGSCWFNTTCPPRQYFRFGACYDVNPLCKQFDPFTGNCLNCSSDTAYNLINGTCVPVTVQCGPRQWQSNFRCVNVSESCSTFDPSNGRCLSCVSENQQLTPEGSCVAVVAECPKGQYAKGRKCVTIPNECSDFDPSLQRCLSCIKGYFLNRGVCQRVKCPQRQVPSGFGVECVNVSPLCGNYDPINGDCLSCRNINEVVRNGKCTQVVSPLAGCKDRERLGFGPCVGVEANCKSLNLVTGNCDQCDANYYFDFTGRCVQKGKCGNRQWEVNGQCFDFPRNCLRVDSVGLCTECISANFRIVTGMCVQFRSCSPRQFLNSLGQCVDVSPNCDLFNPSNGQCITCRATPGANAPSPVSGVCCPIGQRFSLSSKICVSQNGSAQISQTVGCEIPHPSLNFCVRCTQGLTPDYTIPYGCA